MVKTQGVKNYISAVGRRREAVARVRLYTVGSKVQLDGKELKKGDMFVNGKPVNEYFKFFAYAPSYNKILVDTETSGKYIFTIKVVGGGLSGQIDAAVLGIARTLDKLDKEKFHSILRSKGYLTRDPRIRERRKVGMGGKARRKKQSPKR
ncbi:MAG: 30S ribosomal protein S9 [Candidatus Levybacteria bacterium RIFCSPHIGHO2_01_FULL_40_10]|nr:MAG: 30S ribosomal protein S9 [Candidatus Levybacteria bacterium RIFCSPHIGHO2_01_FULL_40_10]